MNEIFYDLLSSPFWLIGVALALDMLIGEPAILWSRLPHPVVLFGKAISALDQRLNRRIFSGRQRRVLGALSLTIWVSLALGSGALLAMIPGWLGLIIELALVTILLAGRSLYDHIKAVMVPLGEGDLAQARFAISMIVGRDTSQLDQSDIARAAIETGAENLSDGVIAPAIWYLIGGLPLLLAYKMINTADSMVGYKSARHYAFGWAAAVMDDIVNFFPARLSAYLILAVGRNQRRSYHIIKQDAPRHASPNAGYPEAAMAAALDIRLGGPRHYRGTLLDMPSLNARARDQLDAQDIAASLTILWRALGLSALLCLLIGLG